MSTHFLPVYSRKASSLLAELVPLVVAGRGGLDVAERACQQFRVRGICSLFLTGSSDDFLRDLRRSGRLYLQALQAADDSVKVTSKGSGFFDAIACGDADAARQIAEHASTTWKADAEYEDDFTYVRFLMSRFYLSGSADVSTQLVARYEAIVDGAPDARLDVCRALLNGDVDLFDGALCEVLEQHERHYQKLIDADVISLELAHTEGRLCVEGLALVQLGERSGFRLSEDYLLIPSVARERSGVEFEPDDSQPS
jgi:hypothetical protein